MHFNFFSSFFLTFFLDFFFAFEAFSWRPHFHILDQLCTALKIINECTITLFLNCFIILICVLNVICFIYWAINMNYFFLNLCIETPFTKKFLYHFHYMYVHYYLVEVVNIICTWQNSENCSLLRWSWVQSPSLQQWIFMEILFS